MNINAQQAILSNTYQTIQAYIKFNLRHLIFNFSLLYRNIRGIHDE